MFELMIGGVERFFVFWRKWNRTIQNFVEEIVRIQTFFHPLFCYVFSTSNKILYSFDIVRDILAQSYFICKLSLLLVVKIY